MKICHITFGYPPTCGGIETHNSLLANYLVSKDYNVNMIVLRTNISREDLSKTYKLSNISKIKVHNIFPKMFPFWILQIKKEIKKIEKEKKIDVFDIHSIQDILLFIFQKRKLMLSLHFFELNCPGPKQVSYPRPCIYSFKNCWRCCGIKRYVWWKILRFLVITKKIKIMVKYDYLKKILLKTGIDEKKIEVVPHWIDVETINRKSKTKTISNDNIKPNDHVFTFFGRLAPEKGPDILLEAFYLLSKKIRDVKLVIIGDGPLRKTLEQKCEDYKIKNRVIFLGMIPHNYLFEYIALGNFIIFPHRFFNYEWALLEAMCTEKAIIATDVPATKDILRDGYNALLTEPSPKSIFEKMYKLIKNQKLQRYLSKNALETIKEKHTMNNLEKYDELINNLVK